MPRGNCKSRYGNPHLQMGFYYYGYLVKSHLQMGITETGFAVASGHINISNLNFDIFFKFFTYSCPHYKVD